LIKSHPGTLTVNPAPQKYWFFVISLLGIDFPNEMHSMRHNTGTLFRNVPIKSEIITERFPNQLPNKWAKGPVNDFAAMMGFGDAFHFSRVFKSVHQVPPSRFRQSTHPQWPGV
jgi:AraC-like DNA-binding protein